MEVLRSLEGITNVVNHGSESLANSKLPLFTFTVEAPKDSLTVRREISHVFNNKNWEIYGMQDERISLEDVFINLVKEHESEVAEEAKENGDSTAQKDTATAEKDKVSESESKAEGQNAQQTEKKEEEEK